MTSPAKKIEGAELHVLQHEAAKRANADPLPGAAGDAFAKYGPIVIGNLSVRPVVASDWKVLKALDSPVIKMLMELRQNPNAPTEVMISEDEEYMLVYQFTHSPKEVRAALAQSKERFIEIATEEIADKVDDPMVKLAQAAVMEQIKRSWVTAISFRDELEEKGEITFFRDTGTSPVTA